MTEIRAHYKGVIGVNTVLFVVSALSLLGFPVPKTVMTVLLFIAGAVVAFSLGFTYAESHGA